MERKYRVNRQIRAKEVRVIDQDGNQVGILPLQQALQMAEEQGLDLVEVAPDARPPVCRLLNYGQWLYRLKKKEREARKRHRATDIKEVKFTLRISDNDFEVKRRQIERFLNEGYRVKITIRMRGRERAHMERTVDMMNRIYESVEEWATIERPLQSEGRVVSALLAPKKH